MTRGGRREGAGRKLGSVSKLDGEARTKAMEGGMMPLDYLLGIMRNEDHDARSRLDAAKAAALESSVQVALAAALEGLLRKRARA
jgi:hypothetical protein